MSRIKHANQCERLEQVFCSDSIEQVFYLSRGYRICARLNS